MKKLVKVMCLAALMLGAGTMAQAQFRQSIFLNGNLPTGNFGSSVTGNTLVENNVPLGYEEIGKAASIGFGLGYRASYRFDVGLGEVAPWAQVDILWNMINNKWRNKYMDADFTTPTYFNIPAIAGVSYFYDELWNDITPFGEFGVGADLFLITSEGTDNLTGNGGYLKCSYKPTIAMAWMIGAGAWFGRHVSAGIYYYGLGTHPVDYTSKTLDKNAQASAQLAANNMNNHGREKRSVGSLALRIGFHF